MQNALQIGVLHPQAFMLEFCGVSGAADWVLTSSFLVAPGSFPYSGECINVQVVGEVVSKTADTVGGALNEAGKVLAKVRRPASAY
jgi:hypothetical protein